jgi:hypothetical protein
MPDPKANVMALPRHYLEDLKKLLKDPEFLGWPFGKLRGFGLFVADLDSKGALWPRPVTEGQYCVTARTLHGG